jgi:hypothetical protein
MWGVVRGGGGEVGEDSGVPIPVPASPADLAAHYDLTISHPQVGKPQFASFERWLAGAGARLALSCAHLHEGVVREAIRRLGTGELTIGFHLDYEALWHPDDDPYAQLAFAVQDAGGHPVNLPARAKAFTDKSAAHAELVRNGLGVPPTVLLRPWAPDRPLTPAERRLLRLDEPGARVYVKPANGFSGRGVVRVDWTDPIGLTAAVASARNYDRSDAYLIQREVCPPTLVDDSGRPCPAYWRVLSCLGELIPFWWAPQEQVGHGKPSYHPLAPAEVRRLGLGPVLDYVRTLGRLSGLEWFSTELCLSTGPEASRFTVRGPGGQAWPVVAIDYLNDQCDVDVASRWAGAVPDEVVRRLAWRFAEAAWAVRHRGAPPRGVVALKAAG